MDFKILIVDDDDDFAEATQAILEAGGYQVARAANGKQGLEMLASEDPDLMILDIMMDSIFEGLQVSTAIRNDPQYLDWRDIPIIMCSSVKADTGERFSLPQDRQLTGNTYLDKPIKAQTLLATVEQLLSDSD